MLLYLKKEKHYCRMFRFLCVIHLITNIVIAANAITAQHNMNKFKLCLHA